MSRNSTKYMILHQYHFLMDQARRAASADIRTIPWLQGAAWALDELDTVIQNPAARHCLEKAWKHLAVIARRAPTVDGDNSAYFEKWAIRNLEKAVVLLNAA